MCLCGFRKIGSKSGKKEEKEEEEEEEEVESSLLGSLALCVCEWREGSLGEEVEEEVYEEKERVSDVSPGSSFSGLTV